MIDLIPGMGVIIERGSGKYLKITEEVEVRYHSSWQDATLVEKAKWENLEIRQHMIDFHELQYVAHTLDFVPMEKLLDPFGDWPEVDDDQIH